MIKPLEIGFNLREDDHVKVMNKLLPKFSVNNLSMFYNIKYDGRIFTNDDVSILVNSKVRISNLRKYVSDGGLMFSSLYEVDIVVSDIICTDLSGNPRDINTFIKNNKVLYGMLIKEFSSPYFERYINMIDSNPYTIIISKIEYGE